MVSGVEMISFVSWWATTASGPEIVKRVYCDPGGLSTRVKCVAQQRKLRNLITLGKTRLGNEPLSLTTKGLGLIIYMYLDIILRVHMILESFFFLCGGSILMKHSHWKSFHFRVQTLLSMYTHLGRCHDWQNIVIQRKKLGICPSRYTYTYCSIMVMCMDVYTNTDLHEDWCNSYFCCLLHMYILEYTCIWRNGSRFYSRYMYMYTSSNSKLMY